jgi:endonuclease/exonuclease/phosphatase family metal-dependent hydrolase
VLALSWNLYHGRSPNPVGRSLQNEFAASLRDWDWDVALLQEVPPWWPPALGEACGASARWILTSRNFGLPLRRWISERDPDLLKANGGGCNALLVRGPVCDHRVVRLTWWPERRWAHGVRLDGGMWVVNLHASTHRDAWAARDVARAASAWAYESPLLVGGDLNLRRPAIDGMAGLGGNHVDHFFGRGVERVGPFEVLERGALSDHPPIRVRISL